MKMVTGCRNTAIAVVRLLAAPVDEMDAVQLQVLREYRYEGRENKRGQRAKHSVHRLRPAGLLLPLADPLAWGTVWYEVFDLASTLALAEPRRRVWIIHPLLSLSPFAAGAVQMLAHSVAVELNFEVAMGETV